MKKLILIIVIVIIAAVIGIGAWYFLKPASKSSATNVNTNINTNVNQSTMNTNVTVSVAEYTSFRDTTTGISLDYPKNWTMIPISELEKQFTAAELASTKFLLYTVDSNNGVISASYEQYPLTDHKKLADVIQEGVDYLKKSDPNYVTNKDVRNESDWTYEVKFTADQDQLQVYAYTFHLQDAQYDRFVIVQFIAPANIFENYRQVINHVFQSIKQ